MAAMTGISVVIPNYNGEALLPQVLPTVLVALENAAISSEIIVVDDCSTDNSAALLRESFPQIELLQNQQNSGFSISSNKGIRSAQYNWVLLLNSDVKLEPGFFLPLLPYAAYDNVFGVMGRIVGWDNDEVQDGAKYPYLHGVKIKTSGNYLLKESSAMEGGIYTMYLSGAAAFMNKEAFISIGGFNELFSPFYVEDYELSLRAWRLGYACWYEHRAICRHRTSATIVSSNKKRLIKTIYNRNKMYLHAIHLNQPKRFAWFLQLAIEATIHFFTLRWFYLRAVGMFARNYNRVVQSRRAMNTKGKLLDVDAVFNLIRGAIKNREIQRF